MRPLSDTQLIDMYLAGDIQAFGELVARYQKLVYNLALRLVGTAGDAEDLTQDIFIHLMQKVGTFRGEAKFSTWLYRLAANRCHDRLRRRHPETPLDEADDPPGGEDPVALAETRDVQAAVARALTTLPPDYRLVVVLRDIQGLSYEEIGESLELSLGTVKSRLSRGRALLAERLRPLWEQNGG